MLACGLVKAAKAGSKPGIPIGCAVGVVGCATRVSAELYLASDAHCKRGKDSLAKDYDDHKRGAMSSET
jgi:hypothetical protein